MLLRQAIICDITGSEQIAAKMFALQLIGEVRYLAQDQQHLLGLRRAQELGGLSDGCALCGQVERYTYWSW